MVAVNTFRGIAYGFRLIIYVLLVSVFGLVPVALGIRMFMDGNTKGIYLIVAGFLYKVVADAVARGNSYAESGEVEVSNTSDIVDAIENISDEEDEVYEE
jgi:hypothetical protein